MNKENYALKLVDEIILDNLTFQESRLALNVSFYAPYSKRKKTVARNIFLRLVQARCFISPQLYELIEPAGTCKSGNELSGSTNCKEIFFLTS